MAALMRPATHEDREKVARATALLREARDLLKAAGAKRAAQKVRLALHSVSGAARHAENRQLRTELGEI